MPATTKAALPILAVLSAATACTRFLEAGLDFDGLLPRLRAAR